MRAKRWILIPVVAAFATLVVSSAAAPQRPFAPQAAQANVAVFLDSVGDARASADIVAVAVLSNDAGVLTFQVVFSARPTCDVVVYIDADRNAATGSRALFGADYAVVLFDLSESIQSFSLRRWTGKGFKEFHSSPPMSTSRVSFSLSRSTVPTSAIRRASGSSWRRRKKKSRACWIEHPTLGGLLGASR